MVEIADRRNELAGNLSLHQGLGFIEKIDQLLEEGRLAADEQACKQIVVRLIELSRPRLSRSLGTTLKLNRDPASASSSPTAKPGPQSSWPRWPPRPPGGAATPRRCWPASPTAPSWCRRRRSPTRAASAAGRRSAGSCTST